MKNKIENPSETTPSKKIRKKRLKTVFSNFTDVINLYVNQSQDFACSKYSLGGRFRSYVKGEKTQRGMSCYFKGRNLYSYGSHYLLARLDVKVNGLSVAILNRTYYSQSTSSHSWRALTALVQASKFVLEVDDDGINSEITDAQLVALATDKIEKEFAALTLKISTYQKTPCGWLDSFLKEIADHNAVAEKVGLKNLLVKPTELEIKAIDDLQNAHKIAKTDHRKRQQTTLFTTPYDGYRSRRNAQKRVI